MAEKLFWPDKKVPELLAMKEYWTHVIGILENETRIARETIERNKRSLARHGNLMELINGDLAVHSENDIPFADDEGTP